MSDNNPSGEELSSFLEKLLDAWQTDQKNQTCLLAEDIIKIASRLISSGRIAEIDSSLARSYLKITSTRDFLKKLSYPQKNWEWAETAFSFIQKANYHLLDLFEDRLQECRERILFRDMSFPVPPEWTYAEVANYLKLLAGGFYLLSGNREPRVAIFSENHFDTACCDLACLFYDILVTPLNPNFNLENLQLIFDLLKINIVITDSLDRLRLLEALKQKTSWKFDILCSQRFERPEAGWKYLGEYVRSLKPGDVDQVLRKRRRRSLTEVCTVMFTSGSTGTPKGVSFSEYNLISKRFARAAALPDVGQDEILLSFLPLYHTFGRYFELLGSIFWRGTYVFSGNPSVDTLLALFPRVNPTGLVSVPIRWLQIYERCMEAISGVKSEEEKREAIRKVVGSRLRWGISAAGYLEPKVFHFFEKHGVMLTSGFGLTEATGGLTMTPPGQYVDNTQGLPLPGVELKLSKEGELLARGHYIARYLEDKGPGDEIPLPGSPGSDYWLKTGDVFRVLPNGYYQIVDRIKDIYKNNRGQTIAPRKIENKFNSVPGIKSAFLVGDGRPYNILLIVPDNTYPEFRKFLGKEGEREYYKRIIEAANLDLAPYERIINFAVLDRDFSRERGELTAKGTFNRKKIVTNYSELIEGLYQKNYVELKADKFKVKIPLWLIRDLGLLEGDFKLEGGKLLDLSRSLSLVIQKDSQRDRYRIGDLCYEIKDKVIDLGLFARQPYLWCGNEALVNFLPCREGWDTSLTNISNRVWLPRDKKRPVSEAQADIQMSSPKGVTDVSLVRIHQLVARMYFAPLKSAEEAMAELEKLFYESDNIRISSLIRLRLEAMANHPVEKLRCWAYRLLLLDQPRADYCPSLSSFVDSGLTFLNEESIEEIASSVLGSGRFEALRQRLAGYRVSLSWPASSGTIKQFKHIFKLLADFAQVHPEFTSSVAAELASWALHKQDSVLSAEAERILENLYLVFRLRLKVRLPEDYQQKLEKAIKINNEFSAAEKVKINQVLTDPTFLAESLRLAYGYYAVNLEAISYGNIWVSRVPSVYPGLHLRVCINSRQGEHYDLKVEILDDKFSSATREKIYWYLTLSEHFSYPGLLPKMASWRSDLGAISYRFFSRLSVGERIRDFAGRNQSQQPLVTPQEWRILYVSAIALIFQAVKASDFKIIPGEALPENISVDSARPCLISLGNIRNYEGPSSLVRLLIDNFYLNVVAAYPWAEKIIDLSWIFDACFEAWDEKEATCFLQNLQAELEQHDLEIDGLGSLRLMLGSYLSEIQKNPVLPISILTAIRKYKEWEISVRMAGSEEREQKVLDLIHEYNLQNKPDWMRFYVYRHTYFASHKTEVIFSFERLLERMKQNPEKLARQFIELSEIQANLDEEDRQVFSRMVFPRIGRSQDLSISKTGELGQEKLVVKSVVTDRQGNQYIFRETFDPAEIGKLYRLFLKENYPRVISQENQHLVLLDSEGVLIGGICFRNLSRQVVFIEGIVVAQGNKRRGIGQAMLRDFIERMANSKIKVIMAHYLIPSFFLREGFVIDKSWGALIRYLN